MITHFALPLFFACLGSGQQTSSPELDEKSISMLNFTDEDIFFAILAVGFAIYLAREKFGPELMYFVAAVAGVALLYLSGGFEWLTEQSSSLDIQNPTEQQGVQTVANNLPRIVVLVLLAQAVIVAVAYGSYYLWKMHKRKTLMDGIQYFDPNARFLDDKSIEDLQEQYGRLREEYDSLIRDARLTPEEALNHMHLRREPIEGSIGIFDYHTEAPGSDYLIDNAPMTPNAVNELISSLNGNPHATFQSHTREAVLNQKQRNDLLEYINAEYAKNPEEDLKLDLDRSVLVDLIGEETVERLEKLLPKYTEIKLRRSMPTSKCINFHTDVSFQTLNVALVDESTYVGGRLVFAQNGKIETPARPAGSYTIHDNTIVHGVTAHTSGLRYGLFFLNTKDGDARRSD